MAGSGRDLGKRKDRKSRWAGSSVFTLHQPPLRREPFTFWGLQASQPSGFGTRQKSGDRIEPPLVHHLTQKRPADPSSS